MTYAALRAYINSHPQYRLVLYHPDSGETYSADPADYWYMDDDDECTNGDGEPLVLVRVVPQAYVRVA